MKENAGEIESRLGSVRARKVSPSAGTVFPNLSIHWLTRTIRVWHPRGPDKMEIWSWAIVDKAAPARIKGKMRFVSQYRFSPTGVFEQDDMDNWAQVTGAARSVIGRRFPANYQMGVWRRNHRTDLRGRLTSRWSDNNQLSLYMHWAKVMEAKNWSEITERDDLIRSNMASHCATALKISSILKPSSWTTGGCGSGWNSSPTTRTTGCRFATIPWTGPQPWTKSCPNRARATISTITRNPRA